MPDSNAQAILLDIEGTTTPVNFVYQVLFPFARRQVQGFIEQHYHSEDVQSAIQALGVEHSRDVRKFTSSPTHPENNRLPSWDGSSDNSLKDSAVRYVYWLMDQDRKSTALKALQGQIWQGGYLSGRLQSQLYPDVLPAFIRWQQQQRSIHIFSSGSILAQKLLFAHTPEGDLTAYISEYFDTTTGAKADADSYRIISDRIGMFSAEVLFVSDVSAELDAARDAGMNTAICVRGSAAPENSTHRIVHTFDVIFPE